LLMGCEPSGLSEKDVVPMKLAAIAICDRNTWIISRQGKRGLSS